MQRFLGRIHRPESQSYIVGFDTKISPEQNLT